MANLAVSPDRIGDAGRQLFGDHWQGPLAKALGVSPRQLRYWLSGDDVPDKDHLLRLVALLGHVSSEGRRLGEYFEQIVPQAPRREDDFGFHRGDLKRIDRNTVEHIYTRSRISFYDYVEQPPADFVPGGTISNSAFWSTDELTTFQKAAWALLADYRYGPLIRDVRRVLKSMAGQSALVADILTLIRRANLPWTEHQVLNALDDLAIDKEVEWASTARQAVRNLIPRTRMI